VAGEFEMKEGQAMAWQRLPVEVEPVLPGTLPVLDWFAAEQGFAERPAPAVGRRYTGR
jgi:8-oxo-dGTP diphosphatase